MRVAILGTGKMGGAMARRLETSGHQLTLWNRTRERAEALGVGRVAATPAEAAEGAEIVISMLTDAHAVRAAYLGPGGAATAARNQVFVEMSTAGPDVARELAPSIERAGAQCVEAPVLGSIAAVEAGKLVVFAAGNEAAIGRARPVLEDLGEVRQVGDVGSAAKLKLVANSMVTSVSALAAELMAAGTAAGLNPEDVFWVLSRMVPALSVRKAGFVEHRYEPVSFALRDAVKDLGWRWISSSEPVRQRPSPARPRSFTRRPPRRRVSWTCPRSRRFTSEIPRPRNEGRYHGGRRRGE